MQVPIRTGFHQGLVQLVFALCILKITLLTWLGNCRSSRQKCGQIR